MEKCDGTKRIFLITFHSFPNTAKHTGLTFLSAGLLFLLLVPEHKVISGRISKINQIADERFIILSWWAVDKQQTMTTKEVNYWPNWNVQNKENIEFMLVYWLFLLSQNQRLLLKLMALSEFLSALDEFCQYYEYSWTSGHLYLNERIILRPTLCFGSKHYYLGVANHSLRQSTWSPHE